MNSFNGIGRLTKDVEFAYTPNGIPRARFTLAINRPFKNQNGEQEADFIQIECWRKTAEVASNYLKKGSLVGITGSIRTGSYEGQDGKRVYFTNVLAENIQFLEPRNAQNTSNSAQNYQGNSFNQEQPQNANMAQYNPNTDQFGPSGQNNQINLNDDDLPF